MKYNIKDNDFLKICTSSDYNFVFNKKNGFFARWGKTKDDDPQWSPIGPELLDIEVTTICKNSCPFCYKNNTCNGKNMSFDTFKNVVDKASKSKTLGQIAFGADATLTSNPELWQMMAYCRSIGIVPNITCADISDDVADNLVKYCGAVACSRYSNKNVCYDSIKKLTDRGMTQVNIHQMVSDETYDQVLETLNDRKTDPRLSKMNAIVFLSLKQKGRGEHFTPLSCDKFKNLIKIALEKEIPIGFDSCSCHKFLETVVGHPHESTFKQNAEACESSGFSFFIDVDGMGHPCSFAPNTSQWQKGIDITKCNDFIKDVWYNKDVISFRENLLKQDRKCPLYKI